MKSENEDIVIKEIEGVSNARELHLRTLLSDFPEHYECQADAVRFNVNEQADNQAYVLAGSMFRATGVQEVEIHRYIVTVWISAAFQWEELEKEICGVLRAYLKIKHAENQKPKE
ncbi:NifU N-terminal domain-containing protein [Patescibacteria group bacterium]|nr:NifU N-terminal domain-containing protein [Patescibacteria group bacterium]MDE2020808.1 NifU N-terminal domain-containing protein [Patescibacteria group bacterium]